MWTIITPFTDKPDIIPIWLECFKRLDFPRSEFKLVWIDMTKNPDITALLRGYFEKHKHEFKEAVYVENPPKKEGVITSYMHKTSDPLFQQKRRSVAETMNIVNSYREGNLLLWEDDIVVPADAWQKMKAVFDQSRHYYGVTGVQYSRSGGNDKRLLAWNFRPAGEKGPWHKRLYRRLFSDARDPAFPDPVLVWLEEKPTGIEPIGASASGFTLYRKEFLDHHTFFSKNNCGQDIMTGFKINGLDKHPEGGKNKLILYWDMKFPHLGQDEEGRLKVFASEQCATSVPTPIASAGSSRTSTSGSAA